MIHGIFFLLYFLLLREKTSHKLNRTYLLVTLVSAFFIPGLEFSIPQETIPIIAEAPTFHWDEQVPTTFPEPVEQKEPSVHESSKQPSVGKSIVDYWMLLKWGYLILSIGLFLRSIFHLVILQKLKYQSEYVEKQWFRLFKTSQSHPFSFLSNVFIPNMIFGTNSFDQILEHECEHVRQHHSLDRLLLDFMVALFWFNPFIFLYRKALIEIHEYQADAAVLKKFPDPIEYQEVLFSQLSTASYSGLVSHFNFSTIKKRIVMINRRNNKRSTWAYALAVPVTLWVILAFSGRVITELPITEEPVVKERTRQESPVPSIGPIKESDVLRLTSGFGMRMHPVLKVKKMHLGVDFSVAMGTEVVATANGRVIKTEVKQEGYGRMITITHGDKYQTRYAQLSSIEVKEGDVVKKGQRIGLSGNSGMSTAPHLHYEVIEVGVGHKDPASFISNYKTKGKDRKPLPQLKEIEPEEELAMVEEERQLEEEEIELEEERQIEETAALEMIEEEERVVIEEEGEMEAKLVLYDENQRLEIGVLENEAEVQKELLKMKEKSGGIEPLFVIDGNIVTGTGDLQPQDIESIVVLKDKNATKAYGKKGKNGVIEIKTKAKKTKDKVKKKEKFKESKSASNGTFRVLIDAGHGGKDDGAVSPFW